MLGSRGPPGYSRILRAALDDRGRSLRAQSANIKAFVGLGTLNSVLAALEADHVDASWAVQSTVFVSVGYTGRGTAERSRRAPAAGQSRCG